MTFTSDVRAFVVDVSRVTASEAAKIRDSKSEAQWNSKIISVLGVVRDCVVGHANVLLTQELSASQPMPPLTVINMLSDGQLDVVLDRAESLYKIHQLGFAHIEAKIDSASATAAKSRDTDPIHSALQSVIETHRNLGQPQRQDKSARVVVLTTMGDDRHFLRHSSRVQAALDLAASVGLHVEFCCIEPPPGQSHSMSPMGPRTESFQRMHGLQFSAPEHTVKWITLVQSSLLRYFASLRAAPVFNGTIRFPIGDAIPIAIRPSLIKLPDIDTLELCECHGRPVRYQQQDKVSYCSVEIGRKIAAQERRPAMSIGSKCVVLPPHTKPRYGAVPECPKFTNFVVKERVFGQSVQGDWLINERFDVRARSNTDDFAAVLQYLNENDLALVLELKASDSERRSYYALFPPSDPNDYSNGCLHRLATRENILYVPATQAIVHPSQDGPMVAVPDNGSHQSEQFDSKDVIAVDRAIGKFGYTDKPQSLNLWRLSGGFHDAVKRVLENSIERCREPVTTVSASHAVNHPASVTAGANGNWMDGGSLNDIPTVSRADHMTFSELSLTHERHDEVVHNHAVSPSSQLSFVSASRFPSSASAIITPFHSSDPAMSWRATDRNSPTY